MAYIKINTKYPVYDGTPITFRAPCDCHEAEGLTVNSRNYVFKDAHGVSLTGMGNLFAKNAVVKVILDVTNSLAYIQNADTNSYLEKNFSEAQITIDSELSETSENPVQNKVIYQELNELSELISSSSGGSYTIPTFSLSALGLPTVSVGENYQVSTDTTELIAALERGPVKFEFGMNSSYGQDLPVKVIMNGAYCYYMYTAVALLLIAGSFIRLTIQVPMASSGIILVSCHNFSDPVSASEIALFGGN